MIDKLPKATRLSKFLTFEILFLVKNEPLYVLQQVAREYMGDGSRPVAEVLDKIIEDYEPFPLDLRCKLLGYVHGLNSDEFTPRLKKAIGKYWVASIYSAVREVAK